MYRPAGVIGASAMPGRERQNRAKKAKTTELAPIRQPFEPGNPGRCRRRQPGKTAEQLGAQLAVNFRGRDAAIGIGLGRAGLRQRRPGRQEELAFGKDAVPLEAAIALMEDAGTQRPLLEVRRERIARKGLGDGVVGRAVAVRGTLAAAQHRPKLDAEALLPSGPRRDPAARRNSPRSRRSGRSSRLSNTDIDMKWSAGTSLLQVAVPLRRPWRFLVVLEFLDETRKALGALRLHVQDNGQDRLPHFMPPDCDTILTSNDGQSISLLSRARGAICGPVAHLARVAHTFRRRGILARRAGVKGRISVWRLGGVRRKPHSARSLVAAGRCSRARRTVRSARSAAGPPCSR